VTVFTNYYENGQVERNFKTKSETRGLLEVFYPSGVVKSRVDWIKGQSQKWEDFYESGKLEFTEEFTRNLDHYLYMRFYYENGNPQTLFELINEKTRTYSYTEFYENGKIQGKGTKVHNKNIDDYQMDGLWQYFDENGKLTLEEEYVRGQLINDKKY
jgi:antitoxin component YwqK of YwqJK toxin-antitoxin module